MYRQKTFLCKIENQNKTSATSPSIPSLDIPKYLAKNEENPCST